MTQTVADADGWRVDDSGFPVGESARLAVADIDPDDGEAPDAIEGTIAAVWKYEGSPTCVVLETGDGAEHVGSFERLEMV